MSADVRNQDAWKRGRRTSSLDLGSTLDTPGRYENTPFWGQQQTPSNTVQSYLNPIQHRQQLLSPRSIAEMVKTPPPPLLLPSGVWDTRHTQMHSAERRGDTHYPKSPSNYLSGYSHTPNRRWKSPDAEQLEQRRAFEKDLGKRPFYFRGRTNVLSNFYPFSLKIFNREFCSSEAAYQYCKAVIAECWDVAEELTEATSGLAAKAIAHKVHAPTKWDAYKEKAMEVILEAKVEQCEPFRRFLQERKYSYLVEDTDNVFWARGPDYKGKNALGNMIMGLRDKLLAGTLDAQLTQENLKEFIKSVTKWPEEKLSSRRQSWSHFKSSNSSNNRFAQFYSPQPMRRTYAHSPGDSDPDSRRRTKQEQKRKRRHESDDESECEIPIKSMKKERDDKRSGEAKDAAPEPKDSKKVSRNVTEVKANKKVICEEQEIDVKHERVPDNGLSERDKRCEKVVHSEKMENTPKERRTISIKRESEEDKEEKRRPLKAVQNRIILSDQQKAENFRKLKILKSEWRKDEAETAKQIVMFQDNSKKADDTKWWKADDSKSVIAEKRTVSIKDIKKDELSSSSSSDSSSDSFESSSDSLTKKKIKSQACCIQVKQSPTLKRKRTSSLTSNASRSTVSSRSSRRRGKNKKKHSKERTLRLSTGAHSCKSGSDISTVSKKSKKIGKKLKKAKVKENKDKVKDLEVQAKKRSHKRSSSSVSSEDEEVSLKKSKKKMVKSSTKKKRKHKFTSSSSSTSSNSDSDREKTVEKKGREKTREKKGDPDNRGDITKRDERSVMKKDSDGKKITKKLTSDTKMSIKKDTHSISSPTRLASSNRVIIPLQSVPAENKKSEKDSPHGDKVCLSVSECDAHHKRTAKRKKKHKTKDRNEHSYLDTDPRGSKGREVKERSDDVSDDSSWQVVTKKRKGSKHDSKKQQIAEISRSAVPRIECQKSKEKQGRESECEDLIYTGDHLKAHKRDLEDVKLLNNKIKHYESQTQKNKDEKLQAHQQDLEDVKLLQDKLKCYDSHKQKNEDERLQKHEQGLEDVKHKLKVYEYDNFSFKTLKPQTSNRQNQDFPDRKKIVKSSSGEESATASTSSTRMTRSKSSKNQQPVEMEECCPCHKCTCGCHQRASKS